MPLHPRCRPTRAHRISEGHRAGGRAAHRSSLAAYHAPSTAGASRHATQQQQRALGTSSATDEAACRAFGKQRSELRRSTQGNRRGRPPNASRSRRRRRCWLPAQLMLSSPNSPKQTPASFPARPRARDAHRSNIAYLQPGVAIPTRRPNALSPMRSYQMRRRDGESNRAVRRRGSAGFGGLGKRSQRRARGWF